MTDAERDAFLAHQRTCRVATVGLDGPHATPLWFHWDGSQLWLSSLTRSQRWVDLQGDPRIGVVVDAGQEYGELRGVQLSGRVEVVGEIPRTDAPHELLDPVESAFARKYGVSMATSHDGRHAWLRVTPSKIVSWDFRKI